MASFHQLMKEARARALGKQVQPPVKSIAAKLIKAPKVKAAPKPRAAKTTAPPPEKQAKAIIAARKVAKGNNSLEGEVDYTIGAGASSREKRLKSKELNLEQKVKVQINRNTWVYAEPGYDIEALRAKYAPKPVDKMAYTPVQRQRSRGSADGLPEYKVIKQGK